MASNSGQLMCPGRSVLVVEDDPEFRQTVAGILRTGGYQVAEASDGQSAWEALCVDVGPIPFSVVITDMEMPLMNGLALAEKIRASSPSLPIVMLTGREDKEIIKNAMRVGVNDFIEKSSLNPSLLLQCVERQLTLGESHSDSLDSQATVRAVRRAQAAMFPGTDENCPIHVKLIPTKDAGGDIFKCSEQDDGSWLFLIADVAGHSVESSYAVASFLGSFATHYNSSGSFIDMVGEMNQDIAHGPFPDIPVCTLIGRWSPGNGRLQLIGAGVPYARLYRKYCDAVQPIALNGTPLGLFPEPLVEEKVLMLEEGDRILFGSDGLFEILSADGKAVDETMSRLWKQAQPEFVGDALDLVCNAASEWADGKLPDDLVAVGFEQPPKQIPSTELFLELQSTLEQVDFACRRLEEFLQTDHVSLPIDSAASFDIVLAAREALANAVSHGNSNRRKTPITLRCWLRERSSVLHVAVVDEGDGFDLNVAQRTLSPMQERGRGLPLILELSSEVKLIPGEVELIFCLKGDRNE